MAPPIRRRSAPISVGESGAHPTMASKEEKERLAEELRQRAHPKFLAIGLEENLAK